MTAITGLAEIADLCQAPFGEAKPALFRGAAADPAAFFGDEHIQQMIGSDVLRARMGLFRDQDLIDPARYPDEYTPAGIMRNRAAGASFSPRGIQRLPGPVRDACLVIAGTGWPTVHAVALESPPGVQALDTHWDCNPVISVQTAGRKRWRVYRPIPAVATAEAVFAVWKDRASGAAYTGRELRRLELADEVVLEPGDAYVVPAGWPHAPMAVEGTSLHVSICPLPQAVYDEYGNEDHSLS